MTTRWNTVIAALAYMAAMCALGAGGTVAGYAQPDTSAAPSEARSSAGAGEPADETAGDAEAPGAAADETPGAGTKDQAEEATPPADEATEKPDAAAADADDKDHADKHEAGKDEAGKTDAEDTGSSDAAAKPEGASGEVAATDKAASDSADAASSAAAEKVKSGDIPVPTDPIAVTAFNVLEKHCARCHQAGPTLKRQKPAKNFGNILHLEQISTEPALILPGNPDGSKLFIQIAKKEMPYDCYQEFDCKVEPTEEEVRAIYDWIKSSRSARGRRVHRAEPDRRGGHCHRDRGRSRGPARAPAKRHALHHAVELLQCLCA